MERKREQKKNGEEEGEGEKEEEEAKIVRQVAEGETWKKGGRRRTKTRRARIMRNSSNYSVMTQLRDIREWN